MTAHRRQTAIGLQRGKDVMQQVTGGLSFTMPMCVPTSGAPRMASQGKHCGGNVTSRR